MFSIQPLPSMAPTSPLLLALFGQSTAQPIELNPTSFLPATESPEPLFAVYTEDEDEDEEEDDDDDLDDDEDFDEDDEDEDDDLEDEDEDEDDEDEDEDDYEDDDDFDDEAEDEDDPTLTGGRRKRPGYTF